MPGPAPGRQDATSTAARMSQLDGELGPSMLLSPSGCTSLRALRAGAGCSLRVRVCVCVCVRERERERQTDRQTDRGTTSRMVSLQDT